MHDAHGYTVLIQTYTYKYMYIPVHTPAHIDLQPPTHTSKLCIQAKLQREVGLGVAGLEMQCLTCEAGASQLAVA